MITTTAISPSASFLDDALYRAGLDSFSTALGYRSEEQSDDYTDYNDSYIDNDPDNDDIF
ncbi:MAG: hypothetical protein PHZ25_01190 [Candidatus Pacebacteria bacterium]|nr:hypothetical protein [Candidatus Paceibacterota bacterium]